MPGSRATFYRSVETDTARIASYHRRRCALGRDRRQAARALNQVEAASLDGLRLKRQQSFVMAFDRLVALARTLLQLLYVHEVNVAPPIFNKARLLKRAGHQ